MKTPYDSFLGRMLGLDLAYIAGAEQADAMGLIAMQAGVADSTQLANIIMEYYKTYNRESRTLKRIRDIVDKWEDERPQ